MLTTIWLVSVILTIAIAINWVLAIGLIAILVPVYHLDKYHINTLLEDA